MSLLDSHLPIPWTFVNLFQNSIYMQLSTKKEGSTTPKTDEYTLRENFHYETILIRFIFSLLAWTMSLEYNVVASKFPT